LTVLHLPLDLQRALEVRLIDLKGRCVMCNRFLEGVFLFELVPPGEMQVGLSDRETLLRFEIARKSIGS
jgi:hypothetical protein